MGLVRDNGVTISGSNADIPGEPQPTGRTLDEAAAEIGQRPLLPAEVPPGITVAVARRSRQRRAEFHGWRLADTQDEQEQVVQACVLVVSQTSLVHYTKRPKPLRAALDGSTAVPEIEPLVDEKYWKRRYNYFARFDEGVRMDPAAWFEVTPESVARHIADRMKYNLVVDGTCGVGGNAIQFALNSHRVIAVDTMAERLQDAAHNAGIYGVRDRIEFVCDDFAHFAKTYHGPQIDAVFLSPPWGGPAHLDAHHFALKDVECPDIIQLFAAAASVSKRVVLYLPRHADLHEMVLLASAHGFAAVEVEKVFFEYPTPHLKLCVIYFWPEALTCPPPAAKGSKKKVGPTGQPNSKPNLLQEAARQQLPCESPCTTKLRDGLLGLPPLAGPVLRAMYCRFHYVGKYAVAVALAFERQQARVAGQRNRGSEALSPVKEGAGSVAEGFCHPALRAPVASALCQAFDDCSGIEANRESAARLKWLLAEVPLLDLLCVASDASTGGPSSNAVSTWGSRLVDLLETRLPEVYHRMLAWRKTAALQASATLTTPSSEQSQTKRISARR